MTDTTNLAELNKREPKSELILRLLAETKAQRPIVSVVDAMEFRRDQYGLTMAEFAAVLGMLPSHYSEFASGKRPLTMKAVRRAYAIGVPADVLLQSVAED